MKFYTIKPEYLTLWGANTDEDTVITEEELYRLSVAWEKSEEELLEQLQEAPFKTVFDFLMDKCRVRNGSGHWCYTFTELSMDEVEWIVENCPSWDYLDERDSGGNLLYDYAPVEVNGVKVWMMTAANLMDDEIREDLNREGIQDPQEFIDRYCKAHAEKYGEDFTV